MLTDEGKVHVKGARLFTARLEQAQDDGKTTIVEDTAYFHLQNLLDIIDEHVPPRFGI